MRREVGELVSEKDEDKRKSSEVRREVMSQCHWITRRWNTRCHMTSSTVLSRSLRVTSCTRYETEAVMARQ